MGIIGDFFGSNSVNKGYSLNWIPLTELKQLDDIITLSATKTVLIFKHSTRCGISRSVLNKFEKAFIDEKNAFDLYFLDLLKHREISNKIAEIFQVQHQSPQLLILKNGAVVASASHYDIISNINLMDYN